MGQIAPTINHPSADNQPISRWSLAFLILLPFLILGSRVTSDATASIAALFLAVFWFMRPESLVRKQAWFKAVLVLWAFMIFVTSFFSVDQLYSLEQSLIFIRWPAFGLVLCCLVFTDANRLRIFERSALFFFLFIALDSILQYCLGRDIFGHQPVGTRLTGPFSKLMPGSYALRIYPMALVALLLISSKLPKPRFLALVVGMIALSQVFAFLTGERIVFLLFGMINFVLLIALIYQEKLSFKFIGGAAVAFIALAVSAVVLAPKMFARTVMSFFDQLSNFQNSSYYQVFHTAIILWEQSPIVGIGTRYFNRGCEALPRVLHPDEGCEVHPHNIYLEWLSQNGVIGLAIFLIILFLIFRVLWRGLDFKNNLLQSVVVFVAPIMLFWPLTSSMSMQTNNYAGLVWLLLGWALARAMVQSRSTVAITKV
ncbi:O-antigen ligase family protein [Aquirhabdus parva]|uniref:O-antigen ligase family protein n=1 Tax=Aquirhabdus parva TaxID=2283318 RepID=A0A345P746_9GAMM|nr:O-antigen ligase family protein [Aquirhabdus parva]AXI03105.1 O-antigen ligase family protein [Aquirhabdus parva]